MVKAKGIEAHIFTCSHPGCPVKMPEKIASPKGWTIVHVEKYFEKNVRHFYIYLCPKHTITTTENQTELF